MTDTIAFVLRQHGIKLAKHGIGDHRTICPLCSAQRRNSAEPCLSVTIDSEHAVWNCHHCGWRGSTRAAEIEARQQAGRLSKPRAVDPARHTIGILPQAKIDWFAKRGIERSTLERWGVGYGRAYIQAHQAEVDVLVFPYRMPGGELINCKFRSAEKHFGQIKGGEKVLWGLNLADPATPILVIVEGEIDALSLDQAGVENAVSVPDGAPQKVSDKVVDPESDAKFSYLWACREELERFPKFVLAIDGDAPGQALVEELARRLGREKCWLVEWPPGCKDANDVLVRLGPEALKAVIDAAQPHPIKSLFDVAAYRDAVLLLYREGRSRGVSTGWPGLDRYLTIRPGELSVVTGIPSSGKSEWVDALLINLAQLHGWGFALCSFENPPDEHIAKLAEKRVKMPFWDGLTWRMSEGQLGEALVWLRKHFVLIRAEDEAPTVEWILEKAGAAVMRYGIRGVVIDPYNEIEHQRPGHMTETEFVSQLLGKLKRFAVSRQVHIWIVAHPTKMQRDKATGEIPIPTLYDISGGAHWSNKPDVGITVARDWTEGSNRVDIWVRKVRHKAVGQTGIASLHFDRATGIYSEIMTRPVQRNAVAD